MAFLEDIPMGSAFRLTESGAEMYNKGLSARLLGHAEFLADTEVVFRRSQLGTPDAVYSRRKQLGEPFSGTSLGAVEVEEVEEPSPAPISFRNMKNHFERFPVMNHIVTGADPEIFIEDMKGNVIPSFTLLPPSSRKWACVDSGSGAAYEDGFQAELAPDARACHQQLLLGVRSSFLAINRNVPGYGADWKFSTKSFVTIPEEMLASASDSQVALGCKPSENVYGRSSFNAGTGRDFPFRMAGGHIHLGTAAIASVLHKHAEPIIQAMDVLVGLPSVSLFAGMEDIRRRQFYGRAGEFRCQKHGLEYRTLSNAWLYSPWFFHIPMQLARGGFRFGMLNWKELASVDMAAVEEIINHLDVNGARKFMRKHAALYAYVLKADGLPHPGVQIARKLMMEGFADRHPTWSDFDANWSPFLSSHYMYRNYETGALVKERRIELDSLRLSRLGRFRAGALGSALPRPPAWQVTA